jgi:hypothetical protein
MDIGNLGEAGLDRPNGVGIGQTADANRDIGSEKRSGPFERGQSAFS